MHSGAFFQVLFIIDNQSSLNTCRFIAIISIQSTLALTLILLFSVDPDQMALEMGVAN